jgi:hypothetical protein
MVERRRIPPGWRRGGMKRVGRGAEECDKID